ncbi:methyltransferase [Pseudenhygromyxa sp. WMMC2535]|uniref:class I SAM-dependent methyltransferase n=1 Tax=Pseudenhygromyxa sp. WMMC2535 TaxID=2712867 RepID=UPI0020D02CBE|nr:methyltransferase [Pseudenhygromyxa sp. WMMC2535]
MSTTRTLTNVTLLAALGLGLSATACDKNKDATVNADEASEATPESTDAAAAEAPAFPDLDSAIAGAHRSDANKARDTYRHPKETLEFFGVDRNMTVVELWPGGGWYTEILGPYLRDEGTYLVANWPADHERYGAYAVKFSEKIAANPELYGTPAVAGVSPEATLDTVDFAPEGSADVVLTFRNSHGWYNNGMTDVIYGAAFKALKPGGIFGVVQHRAAEGTNAEETAKQGYLPEAVVIEAAQKAGFELVEKSEINANPSDTKDHPGGVWNLPPSLSSGDRDNPMSDEDKAKYEAIGESDRMTLKFKKPE